MNEYVLNISGREYRAKLKEITADQATVIVDGTEYTVDLVEIARRSSKPTRVQRPAATTTAVAQPSAAPKPPATGGAGSVRAPLPGQILSVQVKEGATVQAGETLAVMEAMKMENEVPAPHNGTVRKIFVSPGDNVAEGDPLVELHRPEMTTL